ncbi:MAG: histidine phosphatase family protein [Actinobacteria bacterium]|nr:histidine phosphatase family protein [Actinomycetota bacterium]
MIGARVLLVRHAPTAATRRGVFAADEPLDPRGRQQAAALAGMLPAIEALVSPAARAVETAVLAGYADATRDPDLGEADFGAWAGRRLDDVGREDPAALRRWLTEPDAAPPGGESIADLMRRVARLLARLRDRQAVCFTHGGPIKAAVVHALGAPLAAVWRVDVAPCSVTELRPRSDGGWTVAGVNRPGRPGGQHRPTSTAAVVRTAP